MTDQTDSAAGTGELSDAAAANSMVPLWDIYHRLMSTEPAPACDPAYWNYAEIRPLLSRVAREVSTEEAERRVLLLRNPGLPKPFATHLLGCGLQILLGGETEAPHRHTPSALRLVLEGRGAYTTTNDEQMWMHPGDVIINPSWHWHGHGKVSDGEMIWLDGIDVPLINHLHLNFTEYHQGELPNLPQEEPARLPDALPYHYPYARVRPALEQLQREQPLDDCHGVKMRLTDHRTGGNFMNTIAGFMQLFPAGFSSRPVRSSDAVVYSVVEGTGSITIGDRAFTFAQHDTLVVPNWTDASFDITTETVLFSFSDRAMQEALGLWRERRAD